MNLNNVVIGGNLTSDPSLKYTPSGKAVCKFGVALNQKYKNKNGETVEKTDYVNCVAWERSAEVITEHFSKGKTIIIEGSLVTDTWEDKNGGGRRSSTEVRVDNFHFVGPRTTENQGHQEQNEPVPATAGVASTPTNDDDIPF